MECSLPYQHIQSPSEWEENDSTHLQHHCLSPSAIPRIFHLPSPVSAQQRHTFHAPSTSPSPLLVHNQDDRMGSRLRNISLDPRFNRMMYDGNLLLMNARSPLGSGFVSFVSNKMTNVLGVLGGGVLKASLQTSATFG